ncbi:MAG: hypothetical protein K2L81_03975 [Muribaculaceae bacterium]|nr:hypothetical protein [Muribaculaceae bacterium]
MKTREHSPKKIAQLRELLIKTITNFIDTRGQRVLNLYQAGKEVSQLEDCQVVLYCHDRETLPLAAEMMCDL